MAEPFLSPVLRLRVHFILTQTDKKYLGAKAMVQEIKDIVERRRAADSSLSAVSSSAPFASRLTPDLTYNYKDRCG